MRPSTLVLTTLLTFAACDGKEPSVNQSDIPASMSSNINSERIQPYSPAIEINPQAIDQQKFDTCLNATANSRMAGDFDECYKGTRSNVSQTVAYNNTLPPQDDTLPSTYVRCDNGQVVPRDYSYYMCDKESEKN